MSEAELETQAKRGRDTGLRALHPITGEALPVYVANFVLMGYGTGAVMAVPGHDQRDWEFAQQYSLPIRMVIVPADVRDAIDEIGKHVDAHDDPMRSALGGSAAIDVYDTGAAVQVVEEFERQVAEAGAYTERGWLVNSGEFDGLDYQGAFDALAARFEQEGRGTRRVNYRLRDWGVSRQRYWGCPIPVIYCAKCGAVPVPEDQLPVVLPENVGAFASGAVISPIKADPRVAQDHLPAVRRPGRARDRHLRHLHGVELVLRALHLAGRQRHGRCARQPLAAGRPVHRRHRARDPAPAVFPLLSQAPARRRAWCTATSRRPTCCARAWSSPRPSIATTPMARRSGSIPADVVIERDERGAHHRRARDCRWPAGADRRHREDVEVEEQRRRPAGDGRQVRRRHRAPVLDVRRAAGTVAGMERSRRRGHGAVPAPVLARSGHACRPARPSRVGGLLERGTQLDAAQKTLRRQLHETIQKVGDDYGRRHSFNTAIAALMELLNHVAKFNDMSDMGRAVRHEVLQAMVLLLNPVTPHVSHALWQALGHPQTLLEDVPFPQVDQAALVRDALTLAVQVNGKLRGTIEVAPDTPREAIEAAALAEPHVARFLDGQSVKKVIVVPGKIVNIVGRMRLAARHRVVQTGPMIRILFAVICWRWPCRPAVSISATRFRCRRGSARCAWSPRIPTARWPIHWPRRWNVPGRCRRVKRRTRLRPC